MLSCGHEISTEKTLSRLLITVLLTTVDATVKNMPLFPLSPKPKVGSSIVLSSRCRSQGIWSRASESEGSGLRQSSIQEFPKMKGTLFWGPYNMDPTILGTILGSPI